MAPRWLRTPLSRVAVGRATIFFFGKLILYFFLRALFSGAGQGSGVLPMWPDDSSDCVVLMLPTSHLFSYFPPSRLLEAMDCLFYLLLISQAHIILFDIVGIWKIFNE